MIAIFPGSFDPVTLGHCDIIRRAAPLFSKLIVAVLHNPAKSPLFTVHERIDMLESAIVDIPNVEVAEYSGLLAGFAREKNARFLVRSLRSETDCAYEMPMAQANNKLGTGLETVVFFAAPAYIYLSSGMVREVAAVGYTSDFDDAVLDQWVPAAVKAMLRMKFASTKQ